MQWMVIEILKGREEQRGGGQFFVLILLDSSMEIVLISPGIDCGLRVSVEYVFARLAVTLLDKSLLC